MSAAVLGLSVPQRIARLFRAESDCTLKQAVYAEVGEVVTCENGHYIGRIASSLFVGIDDNSVEPITDWTPEMKHPPQRGDSIPDCPVCGAAFYTNNILAELGTLKLAEGQHIHFATGGWR